MPIFITSHQHRKDKIPYIMTIDEMEDFVNRYAPDLQILKIDLFTRESLIAIAVLATDYEDLRKFNLWRFISITDAVKW